MKQQNMTFNPVKTFIAKSSSQNLELNVFDSVIGNESFEITTLRPQSEYEWHHVIVRPNLYKTPSYEAMVEISDSFFQDEFSMQVIPRRCNYVSNEEYTLHLWGMKSPCNFDFKDAYFYLFYEKEFDFKGDICVKYSTDTLNNKCVAVITEDRWPTWEELVKAKEDLIGVDVDAIIINQNAFYDLVPFMFSKYKVVLIWYDLEIELPDKSLV